ncbi:Na+/H+ antiporter family-domain-containing protein [Paraphysoderma sedebokerense]|nr:Na+/H+ antiporter family-domain-containing protein [Paraphysoderma sedebokerense]
MYSSNSSIQFKWAILVCWLGSMLAIVAANPGVPTIQEVDVKVAHQGLAFSTQAKLTWSNNTNNDTTVSWEVIWRGSSIHKGKFDKYNPKGDLILSTDLKGIVLNENGRQTVNFILTSGQQDRTEFSQTVNVIPAPISLIPITATLLLAFITHQVLVALFVGILATSVIVYGFDGLLRSVDTYVVQALVNEDRIKIVLFTWFLSGLINLVVRSGGGQGLARLLYKFVKTRTSAQWATWILGVIIFIDDYSSAIIVGNNMRIITDMVYLSHEKLAFITHATAAAPATLSPLSSWIGFELGLISENYPSSLDREKYPPFTIFLNTIPTRFYPIFMLVFIALIILLKKDFGPMLYAERRAHRYQKLMPDGDTSHAAAVEGTKPVEHKPHRWINGFLPIFILVVATIVGLFVSGYYAIIKSTPEGQTPDLSASNLAGSGNSYNALVWASFYTSVFTMLFYAFQRLLPFGDMINSWVNGIKSVTEPLLVLCLAWGIGTAFKDLRVAEYIASSLNGQLSPKAVPSLIFIISCVISFCTGTSWGTMSIIYPIAVPIIDNLAPGNAPIIIEVISAILAGSIFGDQCSPISDTSILSALASQISVEAHVKTQLPYAIVVAFTSLLVGYLPSGFGAWPGWVGLIAGTILLALCVIVFGTRVESNDRSKFWMVERYLMKEHEEFKKKDDMEMNLQHRL